MLIRYRVAVAAAAAGLVAVATTGGTAFAAGGGYGPVAPPSNGAPGGFTVVAASKVIGPAGGSVSAAVPGGSVSVQVPAGIFPSSDDVVVTSPDLSTTNAALPSVGFAGYRAVAGTGLAVLDASGSPITGRFSRPLTLTITGPSVGVNGEKVLELTGPSSANVVPATISPGSVSVPITSDPDLVVINPSALTAAGAPSTIAAATGQHTGLPFRGETDLAYALAGAGLVALAVAATRRRRRPAAG